MNGDIVVVACFARCIFAPEFAIPSVFLLGDFGGVPIKFIKLVFVLLILILLIISPNLHSHPFLLPSICVFLLMLMDLLCYQQTWWKKS